MPRLLTSALRCSSKTRPRVHSYLGAIIPPNRRCNSTSSDPDLMAWLQSDLKVAMKAKNSFATNTIRSVLAELYAAQKQSHSAALKSSDIISIIRKEEQRRLEAAKQFESAARPDLAQQERKEAALFASYLPLMLPCVEIDNILRRIIIETAEKENVKKAKGRILKVFYSHVDKNTVPGDLVKQRLDKLWPS